MSMHLHGGNGWLFTLGKGGTCLVQDFLKILGDGRIGVQKAPQPAAPVPLQILSACGVTLAPGCEDLFACLLQRCTDLFSLYRSYPMSQRYNAFACPLPCVGGHQSDDGDSRGLRQHFRIHDRFPRIPGHLTAMIGGDSFTEQVI
ncbi:hypothetical protein AB0G54_15320 [Streptomyces yokosukanensis]|uniref:hypothetical protein n=1 Tax=Streptomyces yokosukanensis TaxID=67386 RepID=UPI0034378788